jgi:hypothetical protein
MKLDDLEVLNLADEEKLEMIASQLLNAHLEDENLDLWEAKGLGEEVLNLDV